MPIDSLRYVVRYWQKVVYGLLGHHVPKQRSMMLTSSYSFSELELLQIEAQRTNNGRILTLLSIIQKKGSSAYLKFYEVLVECGKKDIAKKLAMNSNEQSLLPGIAGSYKTLSADGSSGSSGTVSLILIRRKCSPLGQNFRNKSF